jgi:tetratricopeptide (TPR) repeat protein
MTGIIVNSIGLIVLVAFIVPQTQLSEREQLAASQHFKRGMESLLRDQYDVAEKEFKGAVAIDPLYDAAFYGLGQAYMATKRYDEALKAYLASRDAFKAATAAEVLASTASDRRLRDQIDALKDNERNMMRLGTGAGAPNAIDQIHQQIQQLESRKSRRAGATPPPVPAGVSMAIGSAYFRLNDLVNAEKEYKAALEVNPSFGEAHSNLAVVYFVTGRLREAESEIQAAEKTGFKVNPRLKDDIAAATKKKSSRSGDGGGNADLRQHGVEVRRGERLLQNRQRNHIVFDVYR